MPGVFVIAGVLLVASSPWTSPVEARWVFGVVLAGLALCAAIRRKLG
jgi:hypothetical protein